MRSKAAIGSHPVHPALIPIPIGAFALALIGDILTTTTNNLFWYEFSYFCIGIGVITALIAAVPGFIDYFGVKMSRRGYTVATIHMVVNLVVVLLYAVNFFLRGDQAAFRTDRWVPLMTLEIFSFVMLGVSGWLGGQMAFVHKIGVDETADPEATEIGHQRRAA